MFMTALLVTKTNEAKNGSICISKDIYIARQEHILSFIK